MKPCELGAIALWSKLRTLRARRRHLKNAHAIWKNEDVLKRLLSKTVKTKLGCLEFQGARTGNQQGLIRVKGKLWLASRLLWTLKHGPIPKGLNVLHKCDNPPCIQDEHLFLGTQSDNLKDCYRKGRR